MEELAEVLGLTEDEVEDLLLEYGLDIEEVWLW